MATGDITAIVIRADGFSADVTIEGWSAKLVASYAEGVLPDSGNMKLTVTSEGYNAVGTLGTVSRTVNGTLVMRKAYPNEADFDETISGSDLVVRIAFTDCIYDDDKNGGAGTSGTDPVAVITAGYITAGDASTTNAHAGLTCTNNSTLDYPKVIGQWDWDNTPFYKRVEADFNMAFRARHGFGIASVYLQALGVSSTVDTNSHKTAVTSQSCQNGLYHESYQQSVTLSGYTQAENITLKAIAYPVVGDADSIIDTSTNTTAADRIRGLTELTCTCDKTAALKSYGVVATTGNDGTGVVSTTLATAEATPYLTVGAAITGGAKVVYCRTGTFDMMDADPTVSALDYWVEVRPHPSDPASGIVLNRGTNITYTASKLAYIGFTGGITGNAWFTGDGTSLLKLENCDMQSTSISVVGMGYVSHGCWYINCPAMGVDHFDDWGTTIGYSFTGCTFDGDAHIVPWYSIIACDSSAPSMYIGEKVASTLPDQNNVMFEYNKLLDMTVSGDSITDLGTNSAITGVSYVGNLLEISTETVPQPAASLGSSAPNTQDFTNVIFAHNTFAGARGNLFYNDVGTVANVRNNIWCVGNAIQSYNIKADAFTPENGNRVGNWAMVNGVGYRDNRYDGTGSAAFTNDYEGLNSSFETGKDSVFGQMGYVDDASADGTGLGGGDYTPDTGSVLTGHALTDPFITYDLNGNPINSEIGAIQILVAVATGGTLGDNIKRATGGTTINDGLSSWFSRTASESLNDAERRWLLSQAATTAGANNDLWYQFLRDALYTGSLNDMKLAYWKAQP